MLPLIFKVYALLKLERRAEARVTLAEALQANSSRVFFVVLNALPAAAQLAVAAGEIERAVELYALACRYPYVANSHFYADLVGEEAQQWASSLPAPIVAAARQRGRERDLWQTAAELSQELGHLDL